MGRKIRVGIDVGGTHTKAVALDNNTYEIVGTSVVKTTHSDKIGVAAGVIECFRKCITENNLSPDDVVFIAHSTTQATNALLEGDVAKVGIIGIGQGGLEGLLAKKQTALESISLGTGRSIEIVSDYIKEKQFSEQKLKEQIGDMRARGAKVLVASEAFGVDSMKKEDQVREIAETDNMMVSEASAISKLYGLKRRTRTAAINASILPNMPKIMLSHALYKDGMELLQKNSETVVANTGNFEEVLPQLQQCDGLIIRVGKIGKDLIEKCPNLKVISRPGVGVDNVDLKAATGHGIPVVIAPGTNARSVAEHAVALTYAITKNVLESHEQTTAGNFNVRNLYRAIELEHQKIGIIGFGNIGRIAARIFAGNDMDVHVYDPFVKREIAEQSGYVYHESLEECLAACRIFSLHMPSTPQTRGMIGRDQFKVMQDGSFLVNCARGDIVDEDALFDALQSGKVAGAAADVLASEPMDPKSRLFTCPHFIATPHMAALTKESSSRTSLLTAMGTLAVLKGEKWDKVANPEVYSNPRWQLDDEK